MTQRVFFLDSEHPSYTAAINKLALDELNNVGNTALGIRDHINNPNYKAVFADVEDADLTGDTSLLHPNNFPNALCKHRFDSLQQFRIFGFDMLGESERGSANVAGRNAPVWVNTYDSNPPGDGSGDTFYDAKAGPQDQTINGTNEEHQPFNTYVLCGGGHIRSGGIGGGGSLMGLIQCADAAGLGEAGKIRVRGDWSVSPGMILPGYMLWQVQSPLPWEDLGGGIHVQGKYQGTTTSTFQKVGQTGYCTDGDWEDITESAEASFAKYFLKGQPNLSDLNGTGGRARYWAQQSFPSAQPFTTVKTFNGVSYTDITAGGDVLPAGVTTGFKVYFISPIPFSNVRFTVTDGAAGDHVVSFRYSRGGGLWGTFTNLVDSSNGFKNGIGPNYGIVFNPKLDFEQDTIDGSTGYILELTIDSGTVSEKATLSDILRQSDAVYIHRWNDAAPVRGMSHGPAAGGAGLHYETAGKSGLELVNFRLWCPQGEAMVDNTNGLELRGVQFNLMGSGLNWNNAELGKVTWSYCRDNNNWWDKSDHEVLDENDAIFTSPLFGLVAAQGDDPIYYKHLTRWCDTCYAAEILYSHGTHNSMQSWIMNGAKFRKNALAVQGLNDQLFDMYDGGAGDNHLLASRNQSDAGLCSFQCVGFEDFLSMEIYGAGEGGNNQPFNGSGSDVRNWNFSHGYITKWNGREDVGQPNRWAFIGDPDRGRYADGTGRSDGNRFDFFAFKDFDYTFSDVRGVGLFYSHEEPLVVRNCSFINCNWAWFCSRGWENSMWTFVYNAATDTYTEVTHNIKASGVTPTAMFPSTNNIGSMFICALRADMDQPFNTRANMVFQTPANMGSANVDVVYHSTTGWKAVSGLENGHLTSNNVTRFNKPADAALININGADYWAFAFVHTSGTFTTVPVLSDIRGRVAGAALDIQDYIVYQPRIGIGAIQETSGGRNGTWVKDRNCTVYLKDGQSAASLLYGRAPTVTAANLTPSSYQALEKLAINTDAAVDSIYGENLQLIPFGSY